jgi:midasin
MDVMAQTVAKSTHSLAGNHVFTLYQVFKDLSIEVKKTLSIQPASAEYEAIKGLLKKLPYQRNGRVDDHSIFGEDSEPLHVCLQTIIEPRLPKLGLTTIKDDEEMLSSVFVQFFIGCLLLYVPDRPFDPALRLMVEQNRHRKRKMELEIKTKALQDFELVFTGQATSFRVELAKQSLQALGSEPQTPSIVRPRVSGVQQLQAEFNNVLNTTASRFPTLSALKSAFQGQASSIQDIKLLRSNIAQAIDRLSTSFHAYEDVTRPLIAMLQGLDLGLALALLTGTQPTAIDRILRCLCESTPFLGARPSNIMRTNAELESQRTASFDPRFHYLEIIAVARSVTRDQMASSTRTMFQVCHSLYQEWKEQLDRDQQENAAKSSWYRYRGGDEVSNEADDQDFVRLFPTYNSHEEERSQSVKTTFDARVQAQRLASLQRQIFHYTESASQNILNMLRNVSRTIAGMWQDENALSKSPVPAEDMLSAVIVSLEESIEHMHGQATLGKVYNFYTDANLLEVQKLIDLVSKIQTRFIGLQESWPEHATLVDILRTSSEMVALRHTEPIAKLLTKAEQLHGYVHEWQVVASKEYSAASLYDRLTDLLISWRRLELSTWARLLDMEDDKCHKDADSWWFIAYEVIIAVPLSMVDARDDLRSHAEGMFSSLAEFLTATSMGQYSHRLEMVGCFESYLEMLVKEVPAMTVIHNTLVNFLSYYTRFKGAVQESLCRGRQTLEKALKEILLLASWKDTNINALRDSAKRSHHKLFKVVRKYRALLAQPSENILAQRYPENSIISDVSSITAQPVQPPTMDLRALQLCQQHIPSWKHTPERFSDPSSTATRMLQVSQLPALVVDASSYLDSICVELVESIKTLQQETPTKATKDNSETIKYLKARKRKLYTGTLKELRQLGFRSNMSSNVIAKQASISIILTSSPTLPTRLCSSDMYAAEHHFFKLLDMMPLVRERSRNHSEDLTHGEVGKSLGYLESMISIILRQRAVIANASTDLDHLDKTIKHMQSLWAPSLYTLTKQDHAVHDTQGIWYVLGWLPGILEAGCIIIEKHARLSGIDVSTVIEGLMHWKDKITTHVKTSHALPELPRGLSSSQHEQAYARAECAMRDLKAHLHVIIEQYPELAFVLKQIGHWTRVETASPGRVTQDDSNAEAPRPSKRRKTESVHAYEEKPGPLEGFSGSVLIVLDSILVAIQRMPEARTSIPATEEDAAWFIRTDEYLADISRGLGVREVNVLLDNTLSKLQHLSTSDGVLHVAAALSAMAMPIVQQYRNIQQITLARHVKLHQSLCKLSSLLARSFSQIIADGFCSPPEKPAADEEKSENLEEGTGLGEGEGAEDISKDVEDDEDLSELAQQGKKERHGEEIEDQEDAIDMDQNELEGEIGDMSEKGEEDEAASDREEDDIDEETGEVDDLDPTAVDEKLWDGRAEETEKEKEGSKSKGQTEKDERAAADSSAQQENSQDEDVDDETSQDEDVDDETSQESVEEGEKVSKEETERLDPHAQDGRNLDLPDEMDLDNVDGADAEVRSRDSDMDGMSDIEQEQSTEETEGKEFEDGHEDESDTANSMQSQPGDVEDDEGEANDANEVGSPVDTKPGDEHEEDDQGLLPDYSNNVAVDHDNIAPSDVRGLGDDTNSQNEDEQAPTSQAQASKGSKGSFSNKENAEAAAEDGEIGSSLDRPEQGQAEKETLIDNSGSQAFKKLGDALERWHRRQRQIQNASEQQDEAQPQHSDVEMANQDFEHLPDENKESDAQALGAATDEQARALDENAMDSELHDQPRNFLPEELSEQGADHQEQFVEHTDDKGGASDTQPEQSGPGAFIANDLDRTRKQDQAQVSSPQNEEDIEEMDNDFSSTHLESSNKVSTPSAEEARRLWSHYDSLTRDLSFALTEQLRLILAPTLATKMRGDFRTGKRLNIKRIIPYIASQYKRDKIWMRRSIPSKRNYQIMLAVDDSRSMGENGSGQLALETLALVSKSLSMLEVGEICVVGFGNDVHVAHDFGKPFSSEAGVQIFQHFSFQQTKTNVRKLIAESIPLFHEARRRTFNAGIDLWQLELIISDGVCEDHETIRRLVRQAQEERIMIVFVIVDALINGESILDMREAVYEPDATGETRLKMKRYLDDFPFPYYLVVGNVRELPGVLAQALTQWFAEIVDSG